MPLSRSPALQPRHLGFGDDRVRKLAQLLDGIGAGIFGALFPLVVADLTRGTGRFNVSQGAVSTAQGIGASLSNTVAGYIIVWAGYSAAFLLLGGIAAAAFLRYFLAMPETLGVAVEERQDEEASPSRSQSTKAVVMGSI